MTRPIKVLHIFGRMQRGGAEMRTLDVLRHIDRQRFALHFCALSGLPGDLDEEIRALGGEVHLLPLSWRFPHAFRRLLRHHQFDVVHSHVHYSSGAILRLAVLEDVSTRVAHFRSSGDGRHNNIRRYIQRRLMRQWIDRYATHILAVSHSTMMAAWGKASTHDRRCHVIYNGLDPSTLVVPSSGDVCEEFLLPKTSRLFIHVGRFDQAKNHAKLLPVFAAIARTDPMAYLLLVGRGNNEIEQWARARVEELGIAQRVIFAGERHDVLRLLRSADLMLFPSIREGLPGAVLESCGVGTPVLASDLPVIKEIAPHLPPVTFLSLAASDEEWAAVALKRSLMGRNNQARSSAMQAFLHSVFNIDACARQYCLLWQGGIA